MRGFSRCWSEVLPVVEKELGHTSGNRPLAAGDAQGWTSRGRHRCPQQSCGAPAVGKAGR